MKLETLIEENFEYVQSTKTILLSQVITRVTMLHIHIISHLTLQFIDSLQQIKLVNAFACYILFNSISVISR